MSEIKDRLREASDNCFKNYEVWQGDEKNANAREALQEAIHELRKVGSRLEIELAISERDQMAQKPIPIPPHRDARGRKGDADGNNGNGNGNKAEGGNAPSKPRRKSPPRKSSGDAA